MGNTAGIAKEVKQIEEKKNSSVLSVLRIVLAGFLIWLGGSIVSVYQIGILRLGNFNLTSLYQGEILQNQTLVDWYSRLANSYAVINKTELIVWILVPSLLILISLVLFRPKDWAKMVLVGLIIGVIIYGAAVVTNKFDAERKKNSFLKSTQGPQRLFDSIKYPGLSTYFYKDYNGFDDPSENSFTFSTNAEKEEVVNFYLSKGFVTDASNSSHLFKTNVYVAPGGQKISWEITITDENNNLKIKASTNDHYY